MNKNYLSIGKLPPEMLQKVLKKVPLLDDRILSGPGIGIDCAVINYGEKALAVKTDPITFVSNEIGWYAVQICANDIVTTGAKPLWYLATVLFPERNTTEELVNEIAAQIYDTCKKLGISVIGGHTEVTSGLDRPIVVGTMMGEVDHEQLLSPANTKPGDHILLTKGVPIEATAILAREFKEKLMGVLNEKELDQAAEFLYHPGISVVKDAQLAVSAGQVHGMHDPTEGGLAAAIWEMADACGYGIEFFPKKVYVPDLSKRICQVFKIDPLASIASGALLLSVPEDQVNIICRALEGAGIRCSDIGTVRKDISGVVVDDGQKKNFYPRPTRDDIATLFD